VGRAGIVVDRALHPWSRGPGAALAMQGARAWAEVVAGPGRIVEAKALRRYAECMWRRSFTQLLRASYRAFTILAVCAGYLEGWKRRV
jgi:hypothetical protein